MVSRSSAVTKHRQFHFGLTQLTRWESIREGDRWLQALQEAVRLALAELSDSDREVILLRDYEHLDTTSLASLTAGNIAATGGMAKLLGVPPATARVLSEAARRFDERSLADAAAGVSSCDRMLKSSSVPPRIALEALTLTLCGSGPRRSPRAAR